MTYKEYTEFIRNAENAGVVVDPTFFLNKYNFEDELSGSTLGLALVGKFGMDGAWRKFQPLKYFPKNIQIEYLAEFLGISVENANKLATNNTEDFVDSSIL